MNDLIRVVLTIAVVGFIVWLVTQIPMPEIFRRAIIGIAIVAVVVWLLVTLRSKWGLP